MSKVLWKERALLKKRWVGEDRRISRIIEDLRAGNDWTLNLLKSDENGWEQLPMIETCPILDSDIAPRDLRCIRLASVDLSETKGLADTYLDYAVLDGVNLNGSSLTGSLMRGIAICGQSILDNANLSFANLKGATCRDISLAGAKLEGADLVGADLEGSDLRGCLIRSVKFKVEGVFGFLLKRYWTQFGGELQSPRFLDQYSSPELCRYIASEVARVSLKKSHRGLSLLSYVLSNFGRSAGRLLFWIILVWFGFGAVYSGYPIPEPLKDTALGDVLISLGPRIHATGCVSFCDNYLSPFYFSLVTLTTLGFGDVSPYPDDWKGQLYVCLEVIFGYVFLGAFVSLLVQNSASLPHDLEAPMHSAPRRLRNDVVTVQADSVREEVGGGHDEG